MTAPRLPALDGLRGVAVLGILLMNANSFALPVAAYDTPAALGPPRAPDVALWVADYLLVDGKFRAIFSALFGAGLLLAAERAEAANRPALRAGYARLLVLLAIGIAHATLLWAGDILCLYALVGAAALPLRRLPAERLLVLAGLCLAFQAGVLALHYQALAAAEAAAHAPDAPVVAIRFWQAALPSLGRPTPDAVAAEVALHRGPWRALITARLADWPATIGAELLLAGPETLGLMLLGMAGLRTGFLGGAWRADAYRRCAGWLYAAGLLPLAVNAALLVRWRFPPLATTALCDLGALPGRWLVATAHAALVVRWLGLGASPLRARLVAAGRLGLSNYLGTSLLFAAACDGWGLGLFGHWARWQLLGPVLLGWAAMLGWSAPWLRRHRLGPAEWAWRRAARALAGRVGVPAA